MKLVIGGRAQGKRRYVIGENPDAFCIFDGRLASKEELKEAMEHKKTVVIDQLQCWMRECLLQKREAKKEMEQFLAEAEDCIIICDEIGNGIVPMDAFERKYRELTGRMLIELARDAQEVVRVICGIGQKIK